MTLICSAKNVDSVVDGILHNENECPVKNVDSSR
jgi:hypothetical protein